MIRPFAAAMLAALVTATAGHAEGRVSFTAKAGKAGEMTMTERWKGNALRTDIEGAGAYMLMRDDRIYSIVSMAGQITINQQTAVGTELRATKFQPHPAVKTKPPINRFACTLWVMHKTRPSQPATL